MGRSSHGMLSVAPQVAACLCQLFTPDFLTPLLGSDQKQSWKYSDFTLFLASGDHLQLANALDITAALNLDVRTWLPSNYDKAKSMIAQQASINHRPIC